MMIKDATEIAFLFLLLVYFPKDSNQRLKLHTSISKTERSTENVSEQILN